MQEGRLEVRPKKSFARGLPRTRLPREGLGFIRGTRWWEFTEGTDGALARR